MTTNAANRGELRGEAAALHEKTQQNKDNGTKTNAKLAGSAKIGAGGKSKARRSE